MKQSALGSVFFFRRMVIGLDNYKGKESLSRVVQILGIWLKVGELLMEENILNMQWKEWHLTLHKLGLS